ncbi:hypothetical protein [Mucilaginibacter flavidus]|uniref:hypothetical protein n=1 Tax=Mucilaginibacter flavidus TaxID=2949309 RepID=UPI002093E8E6|nr:hypothetical protein [Mucilaginibacter flavidus]MCO5945308.1 hypothetical protein [Mucilaginibacter flavidus]
MSTRKPLNPFVYILLIVICLVISIAMLYINFSDFVMPYPLVIALLVICALVSFGSYIGYLMAPKHNHALYARLWRIVLLILLSIVVVILIVVPILVIENA